MRIEKIINNNIISAFDKDGTEIIAMGKGLGFGKKAGQMVDDSSVEKIFRISSKDLAQQYKELLSQMPFEYVTIANDTIAYATHRFHMKLNQSIYLTLTDHINFAIERYRQRIFPENALLFEIQSFYNAEYQVGRHAIHLLKECLGIEMDDAEAGFIALHFVNAQYDMGMNSAMKSPNMIKEILEIVKNEIGIEIDENTLHYERFITHLKFLLQRVYKKELLDEEDDLEMANSIISKYPKEYKCSKKVTEYISKETGIEIPAEETMYLIIHIRRVEKGMDKREDVE